MEGESRVQFETHGQEDAQKSLELLHSPCLSVLLDCLIFHRTV